MYLGRIVEIGDAQTSTTVQPTPILRPYSLPSVPDPLHKSQRQILQGDVPSPIDPPTGCHFHTAAHIPRPVAELNLQYCAASMAGINIRHATLTLKLTLPMANAEDILELLRTNSKPALSTQIENTLREYSDFTPAMDRLASGIDESMFPVAEWSEALNVFFQEVSHSRIPNLQSAVGYIICCAESQASLPVSSLFREVVEEMLQEFGFEGD